MVAFEVKNGSFAVLDEEVVVILVGSEEGIQPMAAFLGEAHPYQVAGAQYSSWAAVDHSYWVGCPY